jgi:anthranilate phosphoribosyltransferase
MRGGDVKRDAVKQALLAILDGDEGRRDVEAGALLAALDAKSPTIAEVQGLVDAVFEYDDLDRPRRRVETDAPVFNVCGSGKDDLKTFNITTAAGFVAAAAGVCVCKTGSRGTSHPTGSTDVLERLGVNVAADADAMVASAARDRIGYFPVKREIPRFDAFYGGKFYFPQPLSLVLAGLLSPVALDGLVYGTAVPRPELAARVFRERGIDCGAVVTTEVDPGTYVDELVPFGEATISRFDSDGVETTRESFTDLTEGALADLEAGSERQNAAVVRDVLTGRDDGARADTVCLNAGLILLTAGLADSVRDGYRLAASAVRDGSAERRLRALRRNSAAAVDDT